MVDQGYGLILTKVSKDVHPGCYRGKTGAGEGLLARLDSSEMSIFPIILLAFFFFIDF